MRNLQDPLLTGFAVAQMALLLTSNVLSVKLGTIFGMDITAGTAITFPLSYLIGNAVTEVFGYREARRIIWLCTGGLVLFALATLAGVWMPASPHWGKQREFEAILLPAARIQIASLFAIWAGEMVNSLIITLMKRKMNGRLPWVRWVCSTMGAQVVDSSIFIFLAFGGQESLSQLLLLCASIWAYKVAIEILGIPISLRLIERAKRTRGDHIDGDDLALNPLQF